MARLLIFHRLIMSAIFTSTWFSNKRGRTSCLSLSATASTSFGSLFTAWYISVLSAESGITPSHWQPTYSFHVKASCHEDQENEKFWLFQRKIFFWVCQKSIHTRMSNGPPLTSSVTQCACWYRGAALLHQIVEGLLQRNLL